MSDMGVDFHRDISYLTHLERRRQEAVGGGAAQPAGGDPGLGAELCGRSGQMRRVKLFEL